MRMPPLLADFTHARPCIPFCEKYLTLPWNLLLYTTLTPNLTTWSPDKSPRSGRYCRSDLGLHIVFQKHRESFKLTNTELLL